MKPQNIVQHATGGALCMLTEGLQYFAEGNNNRQSYATVKKTVPDLLQY